MFKCKICDKNLNSKNGLAKHVYRVHQIISKEYYDKYLKKEIEGICLMYGKIKKCKKYTTFNGFTVGYSHYCSCRCASNDPKIKQQKINTYKLKTGYEYVGQNPETKKKKVNTYKLKTGYEYPGQNPDVQKKMKLTYFNNTGYDHPSKNPKVKQQKVLTYRNKTGYDHVLQNPEAQEKACKTYFSKTGYRNPAQNPDVQQKKEKTYFQKTGYKCSFQNPDIHEKIQLIYYQKTGYKNPGQNPDVQKKMKLTYFNNTGYDHPSKNPNVKEKIKNKNFDHFSVRFEKFLHDNNLVLVDEKYKHEIFLHTWKCTKCNRIFKQRWNDIQQRYKCPKCYPRNQGQSQGEIELSDYIESLGFDIIRKDRFTIEKEIDIYIPKLNIGIEYDGIWFHSKNAQDIYYPDSKEDPKMKQLIKTELCTDKDIQLIHIFDDEWMRRQDQVKVLFRKILLENYNLLDNDCDTITLNRRFSKNPEYYEKLGYEVKIIEPRLYPNKGQFKVWDVGYLQLHKI